MRSDHALPRVSYLWFKFNNLYGKKSSKKYWVIDQSDRVLYFKMTCNFLLLFAKESSILAHQMSATRVLRKRAHTLDEGTTSSPGKQLQLYSDSIEKYAIRNMRMIVVLCPREQHRGNRQADRQTHTHTNQVL